MTLNIFKEIVQLRNYSEGFIRVSRKTVMKCFCQRCIDKYLKFQELSNKQ